MPQFALRIDLGHILTICILLVSSGVAWGNLSAFKDRQADLIKDVKTLSDKVTEVHEKQSDTDWRLKRIEKQVDELVLQTPAGGRRQ